MLPFGIPSQSGKEESSTAYSYSPFQAWLILLYTFPCLSHPITTHMNEVTKLHDILRVVGFCIFAQCCDSRNSEQAFALASQFQHKYCPTMCCEERDHRNALRLSKASTSMFTCTHTHKRNGALLQMATISGLRPTFCAPYKSHVLHASNNI
jgi:hypothetical protein